MEKRLKISGVSFTIQRSDDTPFEKKVHYAIVSAIYPASNRPTQDPAEHLVTALSLKWPSPSIADDKAMKTLRSLPSKMETNWTAPILHHYHYII